MNIEQSIEILKEFKKTGFHTLMIKYNENRIHTNKLIEEAIETLLTAYENLKSYNKGTKEALRVAEDLEHQANKEAGDWEARCFELQAELEKEKKKNKELSEHADNLLGEKEHYQDCYDGITFKINNLISQIENAIDFIKTDKSKIKVDMYQQKEEDLKLEIVHLKKLLKEE